MMNCSIADCGRIPYRRGWCSTHYRRWQRGADMSAPVKFRHSPDTLLVDRLIYEVIDDCWEFVGAGGGYGVLKFEGTKVQAHRAAYEVWVGSIPEGFFVCHHCDNPPCINPEHLYAGTPQDNVRDMVRRHRQARGELHSKLTKAEVLSIFIDTRHPQVIGAEYGVSLSQVGKIKTGQQWSWLTSREESKWTRSHI